MDFPITDLLDADACYAKLGEWRHPEGLSCPRCHQGDRMRVQRGHRAPVLDYRGGQCKRGFNAFPVRPCTAPSGGPANWS
jgi:hypothetical protein